MVDDSSADRTLCRVLLEEEYGADLDFLEAPDARRGLELCEALPDRLSPAGLVPDGVVSDGLVPDCLLLDYKLPDMTGVEFLQRLGQRAVRRSESARLIGKGTVGKSTVGTTTDLPTDLPRFAVVMLTGLGNEQVAVESMRAGAQDYLVKDRITAESLRLAIEKATGKVGLLRALQAERDRLARLLAEKEALLAEKVALLAEKDALLEEVHHRVKNNLQVIASLLRLQAENFGDARLATALRESQNRVESMALIHEQLYQARNLREVDLAEHAALLANHLMHAYGVDAAYIECRVNVEKLPVGVDRAIPAALILNELISNALKHAFPAGCPGRIEISGGQSNGAVVIEVRDNGVGVAPSAGWEPSQTLGLNIVRILTRQLRGTFVIQNKSSENGRRENSAGESGPGTVCRLTFPGEGENHASRKVLSPVAPKLLQCPAG